MREEIRLGNEALAKGAFVEAVRYYQSLLDKGGTEIEERIARNRLSDIAYQEKKKQRRQQKEDKGEKKARSLSPDEGKRKRKVTTKEEKGVRESTKLIYTSLAPLVDIKKF